MENEVQYSNREVREFFKEIKDSLSRIEMQTIKHNGRLTKVEMWRSYITGGVAAIAFMGAPVLWYVFNQVQAVNASVGKIEARLPSDISTSLLK